MLEKLREGWTLLGVLRRLLVRLTSIDKALTSLADSQALALKLAVLQSGGSIAELRQEGEPAAADTTEDEVDATDADLAEFERIEADMRGRGSVVEDDVDLGALQRAWLNLEEEKEK